MSRYLALDVGDVRIGVAISDPLNSFSYPVEVIDRTKIKAVYRIKDLVKENNITSIVVGLPKAKDGLNKVQVEKIYSFTEKLKEKIKDVEIIYFDERYTTKLAETKLKNSKKNIKEIRTVVDMVAAAIILENYLNFRRNV